MATEPERLCEKKQCDHDSKECGAYVEGMIPQTICYADDHILYLARITEKTQKKITLFQRDKNGENHEKITDLYDVSTDDENQPTSVLHKGYLCFVKDNVVTSNKEEKITSQLY